MHISSVAVVEEVQVPLMNIMELPKKVPQEVLAVQLFKYMQI
jgi:hypothetical protein